MTSPAYSLRVLPRVRDVSPDAWQRLVGARSSPFLEYEWLDALEQTGCVGADVGWLPAHLSLWKDGELAAALPCYAKSHSEGEFVFDWSWADLADRLGVEYYPKFVVAVPFTPATGDRVLVAPGEDRALATTLFAEAARALRTGRSLRGARALSPRRRGSPMARARVPSPCRVSVPLAPARGDALRRVSRPLHVQTT